MGVIDIQYILGDDANSKLRQGTIILIGQQFTPTKSGKIDQIDIKIRKNGLPTGNVWVEIWSDTGSNLPSAQLGDDSVNVDVSTLSTDASGAFQAFTFTPANRATIVAGIKYWVVFNGDYTQDTDNCAQWQVDTDGSGGASPGAAAAATAGPSWSDSGAIVYLFKEYVLFGNSGTQAKIWG